MLFWSIAAVFIILYLISKFGLKKLQSAIDNYAILVFIILGGLLMFAVATKDPIEVFGLSIPFEMQWIASLLLAGFGAWKWYLAPLKQKVHCLDREMGEVKTSITALDKSMDGIDSRVGGVEGRLTRVELQLNDVQRNTDKILVILSKGHQPL